jgi:hypothetical protein
MIAELPLTSLVDPDDDRLDDALLKETKVVPSLRDWDARRRTVKEPLELVAAFSTVEDAAALTGIDSDVDTDVIGGSYPDIRAGARLRLRLPVPDTTDEDTLFRTLDLVQDEDFQRARRRLWSWEQKLPNNPSVQDVSKTLKALTADYEGEVVKKIKSTRRKWIFLAVPAVVGAGLDAVITQGAISTVVGTGLSIVLDKVKAKFPSVSDNAARVSHHPGSAVKKLLAVAGPATAPTTSR